ncbi:DUF397 domain-containing protein [Streptomyces mirabilis]
MHALEFARSSYCSASECVEVATLVDSGLVVIRASGEPNSSVRVGFHHWSQFLCGIKSGILDHPAPL